MKKKIMVVVFIFTLGLAVLSQKPIVSSKIQLSTNYHYAVESQSKGIYSSRLPLVPIYISVDKMEKDRVFYTIYYLPFGTVEMSYSEADGYNIEKELAPI